MLSEIVKKIREEQGLSAEIPDFDPGNGNENAKFLFLLEAPGAEAVKSGYVSLDRKA